MQLKRKSLCAAVALSCLFMGAAAAISVPVDYSTIQAAIDASVDGDLIWVSPGTYNENINFNNKDIELLRDGSTNPVIRGTGTGSVVTFGGSETSSCKISGFTITNGNATNGGGINGAGSYAKIFYCTIEANTAYNGGGIYGCNGPIHYCDIVRNVATNSGGGLSCCEGYVAFSTIAENEATVSGGGLAWCSGPNNECHIRDNEAGSYGGGLHVCDGLKLDCTITGNYAYISGGGLSNCDGRISYTTISGNYAATNGGGLYQCWGEISGNEISSNTAISGHGAGIYSCNEVLGCVLYNNYTMYGSGGAIYNPLYIANSHIYYNYSGGSSSQVPGVHAIRSNVQVIGCTFALHDGGGTNRALVVKDDTTSEVRNCIFAESYDGATAADYTELSAYNNAHYCIFSAGAPAWDPNEDQDAQYNTTADPGFVSLGSDHHLSSSSVARGYAEVLSSTTYPYSNYDIEGTIRGTTWDAGAYQY